MKKFGATLTLLLVLGVPLAIANIRTLYSWFPALKPAVANAIDVVTGYVPPAGPSQGPKFKVEYGYFMIPAFDCPGGRCQQPQTRRLKVQSLNEQSIPIKGLIVNDRAECTFVDGLKGAAMKFGDVSYALVLCEPVRVRIVTEQGEQTYNFE